MPYGRVYQQVMEAVDFEYAIQKALEVATGRAPLIPWSGNWAKNGRPYVEFARNLSRQLNTYGVGGVVLAFALKAYNALRRGKKKQARAYAEIAVEYCKKDMSEALCRDVLKAALGQDVFA